MSTQNGDTALAFYDAGLCLFCGNPRRHLYLCGECNGKMLTNNFLHYWYSGFVAALEALERKSARGTTNDPESS